MSYDFSPIYRRKPLKWPNNARVAVLFTINAEYWDHIPVGADPALKGKIEYAGGPSILPLPIPPNAPDYLNHTWREYGHRVGFWRIMEHFDKYDIKPSLSLNSIIGERVPEIVDQVKRRGWEIFAHGYTQWDYLPNYAHNRDEEVTVIRKALKAFETTVGEPSKGWLSVAVQPTQNTASILAEEGVEWFCDYINDDQPYPIRVGDKTLIAIPYSPETNDYGIFVRSSFTPEGFFQYLKDGFDTLYEEGEKNARIMSIGLHPHVIGRPFRIRALDRLIDYITGHKEVWFPTRTEIANWYKTNYLDEK